MEMKFAIITLLSPFISSVAIAEELNSSPWSIEGAAVVDLLANTSGGIQRESSVIGNIGVQLNFDGSKIGIPKLRGTLGGFYNNGEAFTGEVVGDLQTVSNIEAGADGFYLYENWLSINIGEMVDDEGQFMVKFGVLDLNGSFDTPNVSELFVNSSHGIVPTFSQLVKMVHQYFL